MNEISKIKIVVTNAIPIGVDKLNIIIALAELQKTMAELIIRDNPKVEPFNDIELTPKEINETLREAGYDPQEVGERMAKVAREASEQAQATGEAQ